MPLTNDQRERYTRHLALAEVGEGGQERLGRSSVLVVGAGGLGSPVALYLTAVGVGTLGVMDNDRVQLSNLQRQILHGTAELGGRKTESARATLQNLNPDLCLEVFDIRLEPGNAGGIVEGFDFVVDATDNFESRFVLAEACHLVGTAYSHAGVMGMQGQALTVLPSVTACYRCVFPESPDEEDLASCQTVGLLGTLPGILGTIQATEAVKYLLGIGELLTNRLLTVDARRFGFRTVPVRRNANCPLCSTG